MALRREILSYVATTLIGAIAGYYIGVQELLGIQSERTNSNTDRASSEATETGRSDPPPAPTTDRFSFEQAAVDDPVPAGEWYVMTDEGTHEISDERATDGEQSIHMQGTSGLGQTRVAIDLDLSRIESIAFDAYPVQNDTYAGDIKIQIDNTDNGIGGVTQATTGQWHEISGSVSEFDGTHTMFLWTRGDGNEAFFDNGRLRDETGATVPPDEVVVSA